MPDTPQPSGSRPSCCRPTGASGRGRRRSGPRPSPRSPRRRRTYLGTSHRRDGGAVGRPRASARAARAAPAARRLRGARSATAARRRSGTRPRSGSSTGAASTCQLRRVLVQVRGRDRGRARTSRPRSSSSRAPGTHPDRVADDSTSTRTRSPAQRDLHRRHGRHPPARGRDPRRRARARRRHVGRRRAARRPDAVRRLLLRAAEGFGSEGGLWLARCSPAAIERIERIAASGRWMPPSLDLRDRARELAPRPDLQHPGARDAVPPRRTSSSGCSSNGGLEWAASRCDRSAEIVYGWAEAQRRRDAVRGEAATSAAT